MNQKSIAFSLLLHTDHRPGGASFHLVQVALWVIAFYAHLLLADAAATEGSVAKAQWTLLIATMGIQQPASCQLQILPEDPNCMTMLEILHYRRQLNFLPRMQMLVLW